MNAFETACEEPSRVTQHRPAQADLLDDAFDPGVTADDDVVAVEVRTLHEDQEAHHVVEDDVPRREHDGHDDEDDGGEDRVQLEDGQHHDDEPGQDTDPEELEEQVLDRPDALADLVGRSRSGREVGCLRIDDGGHERWMALTPTR